jgi:dihydrolipoamide dehydrogenase
MVVGELAEPADLIVIGGGPGGYVAALRAAQLGRKVLLIEANAGATGLGGTCLHVGCIPSKTLIELGEAHSGLRRLATRGLVTDGARIELAAFQADKAQIVRRLSDGVGALLRARGVEVVAGHARLTAPNRIAVEHPDAASTFYEFAGAIIATGSRPAQLAALPRDGVRVLDSTDVLALDAVPATVAIVGGGYIGLELASALHALGAQVTVLELGDRLLPGVDAPISTLVRRAFVKRGIAVHTGALVTGDDGARLTFVIAEAVQELAVDAVVVAAGRRPNSDDVGFGRAGVTVAGDGTVVVSPARLALDHLAVIGDLTAGPALAHKAMAEGVVAAEALCGRPAAFDPAAIPAVVYTDPEVALAGESEASAAAAGLDVVVSTVPMAAVPRSLTLGAPEGVARILSEPGSGVLLGVQLVGRHVSESIAEAVVAIELGATVEDLAASIHPHPSMSEAVAEAAHLALGAPLHVLG